MKNVKRLSEFDETTKIKYFENYNKAIEIGNLIKPNDEYDDYGLKFPIEYLSAIGKSIIFFPIEIMAQFVDETSMFHVDNNDEDFTSFQITKRDRTIEDIYPYLNATSLGNMAYIALNCKNQQVVELIEADLDYVFVKYKGEFLNLLNEHI